MAKPPSVRANPQVERQALASMMICKSELEVLEGQLLALGGQQFLLSELSKAWESPQAWELPVSAEQSWRFQMELLVETHLVPKGHDALTHPLMALVPRREVFAKGFLVRGCPSLFQAMLQLSLAKVASTAKDCARSSVGSVDSGSSEGSVNLILCIPEFVAPTIVCANQGFLLPEECCSAALIAAGGL